MSAAKAKPSVIAASSRLSMFCAKIFKGFYRQFRAVGIKRPAELNAAPAIANGAMMVAQGPLPPEDQNAAMAFEFGSSADHQVVVHIDPKETLALDQSWQHNKLLFHLDPRDLDRLQLFQLHCLLQDYDAYSYKGYFHQAAARGQQFTGPFTAQDSLSGILARHQISLNLSPYLDKTFQLFCSAISSRWQGPIEGRLAMMPGVIMFNFKSPVRPNAVKPLLSEISPSGAGPSEPIHLVVDYSQIPTVEATLVFFFVASAIPQTFPIKEITILPRS